VEVWDENDTLPAPNPPGLDDESGRGLIMVEALAERWGWDLAATGLRRPQDRLPARAGNAGS
jgi:hypothetical protein